VSNQFDGVSLSGGSATLGNVQLKSNKRYGLQVQSVSTKLTVTGGNIDSNVDDNIHIGTGNQNLDATLSTLTGTNSTRNGMTVIAGKVGVTGGNFSQNGRSGIETQSTDTPELTLTGCTLSGNAGSGLNANKGKFSVFDTDVYGNGTGGSGVGMHFS